MYIDLHGKWKIELNAENGMQSGEIVIPGILQGQGYGNEITLDTKWVSGLHDEDWFEREEYKYAAKHNLVPFLAQPPKHFMGVAGYEKTFVINKGNTAENKIVCNAENKIVCNAENKIEYNTENKTAAGNIENAENTDNTENASDSWLLYIEITHWHSVCYIDGVKMGEDCSLCSSHIIRCGKIGSGEHVLRVEIDNAMQYPYRPDGHAVSDALGATWNGMAGEVALITEDEWNRRLADRKRYAAEHPVCAEVKDGRFCINGKPEYMRGTHIGGEYPINGYPNTDVEWWRNIMLTVKRWGLNFIRCHSFCPPDAAFVAADEEQVYLQPECGMWNHFNPGIEMNQVLRNETKRILEQYGHHPSFVMLSSGNEPSGNWYGVLREWVKYVKKTDCELGYAGRRLYTAQSGWYYDVEPSKIEGTDYIYFHRSAHGPIFGGNIRGFRGWRGRDYEPSIEGAKKPVICHELGQWCSYPDFCSIDRFKGYLRAGNLEIFRDSCRKHGLLDIAPMLTYASGRNQIRLYKEDLEANFRTKGLYGFELLDIHDYMGQGTAVVGFLDAFWQEKGYVNTKEWRRFCGETVILARLDGYVYQKNMAITVPVEVCHFGREDLHDGVIHWELTQKKEVPGKKDVQYKATQDNEEIIAEGTIGFEHILCGQKYNVGSICLDFSEYSITRQQVKLRMYIEKTQDIENEWNLYIYNSIKGADEKPEQLGKNSRSYIYTRDWEEAIKALQSGSKVVYSPHLTALDYNCPSASIRNVFWNAQMGPTWGRSLGMIADSSHHIFDGFETDATGGWQWEEILRHSRCFPIEELYKLFSKNIEAGKTVVEPIVRIIDDWNRNLPLAILWECRTKTGSLLFSSVDLGDEERLGWPDFGSDDLYDGMSDDKNGLLNHRGDSTLYGHSHNADITLETFRKSVFKYADSKWFSPKNVIDSDVLDDAVRKHLFPVLTMEKWGQNISCGDAVVNNPEYLWTANPNQSIHVEKNLYPIDIDMEFKRKLHVTGICYVPEQRSRYRRGFVKDYEVWVWATGDADDTIAAVGDADDTIRTFDDVNESEDGWRLLHKGRMKNTSLAQHIEFNCPRGILTGKLKFRILSTYGRETEHIWDTREDGWYEQYIQKKGVADIACLMPVCTEKVPQDDTLFWEGEQSSKTKEIEQ